VRTWKRCRSHRQRFLSALLAIAWLAACTNIRPPLSHLLPNAHGPVVYVIDRGWHTDIGLAKDDIRGPLASIERAFPGVRYLVFGFGERAFLLSRRTDLLTMIRALFPSPAAMLVTALRVSPVAAFEPTHVIAVPLSPASFDRLNSFIWSYLARDSNGPPRPIAEGPYPGSLFYAAAGTYDATFTCNTWTAAALREAGLPVSPEGVMFAGQVMDRVGRAASLAGAAITASGRTLRDDNSIGGRGRGIAAAKADTGAQHQWRQ
jgi:uncharacterized protein (TIGR02117 family)